MIDSPILRTFSRLLLPLLLAYSLFLLLRGHHEPGGGFIGGLVASSAFALYSLAWGPGAVRRLLRLRPLVLAGVGLAAALAAALAPAVLGGSVLAGRWLHLGALDLGTPLLFDAGVYLAVIGAMLAVVLALEDETA